MTARLPSSHRAVVRPSDRGRVGQRRMRTISAAHFARLNLIYAELGNTERTRVALHVSHEKVDSAMTRAPFLVQRAAELEAKIDAYRLESERAADAVAETGLYVAAEGGAE